VKYDGFKPGSERTRLEIELVQMEKTEKTKKIMKRKTD